MLLLAGCHRGPSAEDVRKAVEFCASREKRIPVECAGGIMLELARKIDELRVIEAWLQMSLNMMQMSIKTMELQKASLEAMRAATAGTKPAKKKSGS